MVHKNARQRPPSVGRYLNFATATANALCNTLLAKHDLTLQQWVVLSALWQKDGASVSELADYTRNSGPATTRILDRMVEKGLVVRRQDPEDRRGSRIFLQPKGEALRHLQTFYEEVNAILLEGMTEREVRVLYDLLERVSRNASQPRGE